MLCPYRRILAALAMTIPLSMLTVSAPGSVAITAAAAIPAAPADGLSGTWQVSRTCLTICVSPKPVRKVVRRLRGNVFTTAGASPQVLYRMGLQVLVHGLKDSLLLAIKTPGVLMSGVGVGADGSTFKTTWRCVAAPGGAAITAGSTLMSATPAAPVWAPMAMGVC